MSCKSVFCIIGIDQCDRDILNAIHLCREQDAHLSVLIVSLAPTPIGGYGVVVSAAWLLEREADIAAMKKREKQIISLVQTAGLKADVDSYYCEKDWADEIIGQRARFSDLTIIGPDLTASACAENSRAKRRSVPFRKADLGSADRRACQPCIRTRSCLPGTGGSRLCGLRVKPSMSWQRPSMSTSR